MQLFAGLFPPQVSAPICDNFVPTREVEYDPDSEHDDKVRYLTDQQIEELKVYQSKLKYQRSYEIMDYFFFRIMLVVCACQTL